MSSAATAVKQEPNRADLQRDLSVSYEKMDDFLTSCLRLKPQSERKRSAKEIAAALGPQLAQRPRRGGGHARFQQHVIARLSLPSRCAP